MRRKQDVGWLSDLEDVDANVDDGVGNVDDVNVSWNRVYKRGNIKRVCIQEE